MKILSVVGARPNFIKIAPLMREMRQRPEIQSFLVHTGQHYDEQLSDIFFRQLGISEPDVDLRVGSGSHAWQTAEVLKRIEPVLVNQQPDVLLVVGDVNSTVAASLAAVKLGILVAHVEAGLRSFDRSMPEEINRILTDAMSDYLFVTEEAAMKNLLREGKPLDQIHFVGNVMIDALNQFLPLAAASSIATTLSLGRNDEPSPFALMTLHRPSNVDSPTILQALLQSAGEIADRIPVIFPVHPRTQLRIEALRTKVYSQLRLISPVGYLDFLWLMSRARFVMTDSGGIQEETTALGVPCLTLRENTERPVTVEQGTNQIVGTEPERIISAAHRILSSERRRGRTPLLWDGKASERIVAALLRESREPINHYSVSARS
jgi:UDP-N-acetylglucosamine 2-epimerase (non-hydrolysing)